MFACMARASRHTNDSIGEDQREASATQTLDLNNELVEIVRALARAAAREDYRKALDANAISPTEAAKR